jgi:DnaJ family protein A protein 2
MILPLEDLYKCMSTSINLTRRDVCITCDGKGSQEGALRACTKCFSYNIRSAFHQMDPRMPWQQLRYICSLCQGEGAIVNDKDKCQTCDGRTVITGRISLQAHSKSLGYIGQLSGESRHTSGVVPGNIIVEVHESMHTRFHRQHDDLFTNVEVDLLSTLGGGQFRILQLDGRVLVGNFPPGLMIKRGNCPRSARGCSRYL